MGILNAPFLASDEFIVNGRVGQSRRYGRLRDVDFAGGKHLAHASLRLHDGIGRFEAFVCQEPARDRAQDRTLERGMPVDHQIDNRHGRGL